MHEICIYDLSPNPGDTLENFYPGASSPLPPVGEQVLVLRMDGSGITYPAKIHSVNQKLHTYSVRITDQLSLPL